MAHIFKQCLLHLRLVKQTHTCLHRRTSATPGVTIFLPCSPLEGGNQRKNQHLQTPESLLTCFMFLLLHLCAVSFICNTVMCVSLSSMLVYVRIFMHIHIHKCVRVEEVCRNACVIVQCASEVFI